METNLNKAIDILKKNNQEHIISFLDNGNNQKLINQVLSIDFNEIKELYKITNNEKDIEIEDIQPIVALNPSKLSEEEIEKLKNIGADVIKNGKFAVSTMAGRSRNKASDIQNQRELLNYILMAKINIFLKL